MAKPENRLKKYLIKIMGTRWDIQSHEDRYSLGIPDLSYGAKGVNGWIELKQVKDWPMKPDTPVDLNHFTPLQVNWLRRRGKKGSRCYVLIKISNEYFVFSFLSAMSLRAGMTRKEFYEDCILSWDGLIYPDELLEVLTNEISEDYLESL